MKITRLGLDLAKNMIQMHAVNARNEMMVRKAFSRIKLMAYMQDLEPCLVGMEACAGTLCHLTRYVGLVVVQNRV